MSNFYRTVEEQKFFEIYAPNMAKDLEKANELKEREILALENANKLKEKEMLTGRK